MTLVQQIRDFEGSREDQKATRLMKILEETGLVEQVETQGFQLSVGYEPESKDFSICILDNSRDELAHLPIGRVISLTFESLVRDWLIETLPLL